MQLRLDRIHSVALGFKQFDIASSFDIGIYGIATLAVVALLIPRDPVCEARAAT
jgi:hypothetical protein